MLAGGHETGDNGRLRMAVLIGSNGFAANEE